MRTFHTLLLFCIISLFTSLLYSEVNVKNYGAVGDGVVDDTTAIQKALDTKDNVYFPAGKYRINKQPIGVTINSSMRIRGDGIDKTFIILPEDPGQIGVMGIYINSGPYKVRITDLTINSSSKDFPEGSFACGLKHVTATEASLTVERCRFTGQSSWGIKFETTQPYCVLTVRDCKFTDCKMPILTTGNNSSTKIYIVNCNFTRYGWTDNHSHACYISQSHAMLIDSCHFYGNINKGYGVHHYHTKNDLSTYSIIRGCYFEGNGTAILGSNNGQQIIRDCVFNQCKASITLRMGKVVVDGCQFLGNSTISYPYIQSMDGTYCRLNISNCRFQSIQYNSIRLNTGSIIVINNTEFNTTQDYNTVNP